MSARIAAVERMLGRRLDALTETDLQQATLARVPETQHLDFKQLLDDSDKHRDSFASDVCAFANAGGGVILYGIAEDGNGHAERLTPFPKPQGELRLKLRGILSTRLRPTPAFDALWIDSDEQHASGYLVVVVPASNDSPHAILRPDRTQGTWLQYPIRRETGTEHLTESEIATRYERRFRTASERQALCRHLMDGVRETVFEDASTQLSVIAVPLNPGFMTLDDELRASLQRMSFGQRLATRSFGIDPQLHSHAQRFVQRGVQLDHPDGSITFYSDGSFAATAQLDRVAVAGYGRHRQAPGVVELNWMCVRLAGLLAFAADVASEKAGCAGDLLVSVRLNSLTPQGTPRPLAAVGQDHPNGLMTFLRGDDCTTGPIMAESFVNIEMMAGDPNRAMVQEIQRVAADITQALNVSTPIGITNAGAIDVSGWSHLKRDQLVGHWVARFAMDTA